MPCLGASLLLHMKLSIALQGFGGYEDQRKPLDLLAGNRLADGAFKGRSVTRHKAR